MVKYMTAKIVLSELLKTATTFPITPVDQDDYSRKECLTPRELRNFLAGLRLLEGVPFSNIVPDAELLPPESIRFFYLDRAWTDALVQGVLSVGTVNSADRAQLERLYPDIQKEIDQQERRVRQPKNVHPQTGTAGLITGFIMRSRAVSGWPGLHVRAYKAEPSSNDEEILPETHKDRIKLLRLERLAPAVMLVLFDGLPQVVHIEEPRQGLQFGVKLNTENSTAYGATVPARNVTTAKYVGKNNSEVNTAKEAKRLPVQFRPGSPGVLDLANTSRAFLKENATRMNADKKLDGAEFALEMIRFPYRQVFGDPSVTQDNSIRDVFRPSVDFEFTNLEAKFRGVLK